MEDVPLSALRVLNRSDIKAQLSVIALYCAQMDQVGGKAPGKYLFPFFIGDVEGYIGECRMLFLG